MISRIAAVHSVAPIISDPIYGPKTLNSQLVNGLLVTSGMMPSAPGAVILNLPAHSNITIIPMLQTRKGIFRSATNAAIFVRTLFACDASADVVSVIKGLLHVMIHRCQILKADLKFNLAATHSVTPHTPIHSNASRVPVPYAVPSQIILPDPPSANN